MNKKYIIATLKTIGYTIEDIISVFVLSFIGSIILLGGSFKVEIDPGLINAKVQFYLCLLIAVIVAYRRMITPNEIIEYENEENN